MKSWCAHQVRKVLLVALRPVQSDHTAHAVPHDAPPPVVDVGYLEPATPKVFGVLRDRQWGSQLLLCSEAGVVQGVDLAASLIS